MVLCAIQIKAAKPSCSLHYCIMPPKQSLGLIFDFLGKVLWMMNSVVWDVEAGDKCKHCSGRSKPHGVVSMSWQ